MKQPPYFHFHLHIHIHILLLTTLIFNIHHTFTLTPTTTTTPPPTLPPLPSPSTPKTTLDPKQLKALQSLNLPTPKDPCTTHNNPFTQCDTEKPFRHVISLHLINCSDDISVSTTALKSLSTLQDLSFINCPTTFTRFPPELTTNLRSFTCINSLPKLTGVFLGKLENVTDLIVTSVPIKASGPFVILGNLKKINKIVISHANLTGVLPKSWHHNLSYIDFSYNELKGKIPSSLTELENLVSLNLAGNQLNGELPDSIGDLIGLKNLSISSNSLSGSVLESMASMIELEYIDLSSNQFNGTIPNFFSRFKKLKYLNLEKNNFEGVMPFNGTFIKNLEVFKIGDNSNLCYNHTSVSPKVKLGLSPCDKNGLPMAPPASSPDSSADDSGDGDGGGDDQDETSDKGGGGGGGHGPNKVVLGIAIALSSIVFLIIFLICLSRKCV